MRAMPPPSAATRSVAFSLSNLLSVASASARICAMRLASASLLLLSVIMVVSSLPTTTRSADPSISIVTLSREMPTSSATYVAPVAMAISWRYAFRRSPKAGALMAARSRTPRSLFTTRADKASPATSSATMNSGSFVFTICSRIGIKSLTLLIALSVTSTRGLTSSQICLSVSLTKYGERYPRSIDRPSVNSTSSTNVCDSSTTVDPVSPTFSYALAIIVPMLTLFAAMVPIFRRSSLLVTGFAMSRTF
mmetsp:Transcript_2176/g.3415  ORF Transcript_2176/g.3415 Transcript_2176/m.3415 type:complete len:250 (-) Transcript_2176:492-1241(-)